MEYSWMEYGGYEPFVPDEVYLHVPAFEELSYRQKLLADPQTMSYNAGYDLSFKGYDREKGTIAFEKEDWAGWYEYWINNQPQRFYAYVMRKKDHLPLGEVCVHEDAENGWHETGVVIEAKYRSMGYGKQALFLLMRHAFYDMGVRAMHNSFENERYPALAMHMECGFLHLGTNDGIAELICGKPAFARFRKSRFYSRKLGGEDRKDVLDLYNSNPHYFELCPPQPSEESVIRDMNALPPGTDPSHKHFVGWYEMKRLIGVCDLIEKYPDEDTLWIGLFMIRGTHQCEGLGTAVFERLCAELAGKFRRIALGCYENNTEGISFWKQCGFVITQVNKDGIAIMEKQLPAQEASGL